MNTKIIVKHLAKVITFTLIIQFNACWAADGQAEKIAAFVSNAGQKIGGAQKIGVKVKMNWTENPEVKEVTGFGADKRIATLMNIILLLSKNDKKIFPNIETNSNQLAVSIITRIFSLTKLSSLLSSEDNDFVIRAYLDGEIADLKMVLNRKINYGSYLHWHKERDNKLATLIFSEEKIILEMVPQAMEEANITQVLANKTTLISLLETCVANTDLCSEL